MKCQCTKPLGSGRIYRAKGSHIAREACRKCDLMVPRFPAKLRRTRVIMRQNKD